jgi:hypothetical protein
MTKLDAELTEAKIAVRVCELRVLACRTAIEAADIADAMRLRLLLSRMILKHEVMQHGRE